MTALIQTKNVSKTFGSRKVFEAVSFEVHPGQHLAVLGASGCGKSTLLRLLAGLEAPTEGQVWIEGQLASNSGRNLIAPHERRIAMVFQDLALWPTLTAQENVILGLAQTKVSRSKKHDYARQALEACRVGELANRHPATLSIGQQQRVAFARALAVRPKLLLLDEPFSSLDPLLKGELFEELINVARSSEITLALVTHNPLEAVGLCEWGLVIENGALAESGPLRRLFGEARSDFLRAFAAQLAGVRPAWLQNDERCGE